MAEFAWVNFELPSRGFFYKDGSGTPLLDAKGTIQIRKLSFDEQALLQSQGVDVIQRISSIVRKGSQLPKSLSPEKLLITDRMAVLLYIRVLTFGPSYTFTWRCNACRATVKSTINIVKDLPEVNPEEIAEKLQAKDPPEELVEPFTVYLPGEKKHVTLRLLRGDDESEIFKQAKRARLQSMDSTDPSHAIRMALSIVGVEGENFDQRKKERFVHKLDGDDALRIEYAIDDREPSIDSRVYLTCSACGAEDERQMPFDAEFFRPRTLPVGDAQGA